MNPWNKFWFRPISSAPLGLFRIVFGFLVFVYAALLFPERTVWFTERGIVSSASVKTFIQANTPGPHPIDFLGNISDTMLTLFFILFFIAAFLLMVGWWARPAALFLWVALNATHNRNPVMHNSGDLFMLVMCAYLFFTPAGAACSVERLWRIWNGKEGESAPLVVPWAQRLMQLQVCLLYFCTAFGKSGSYWHDGTAIYYAMHLPEMGRFPVPFMDENHVLFLKLVTFGTMTIEWSLPFLVWVPWLRLPVLFLGVCLHLGIEYAMNIPLFSFLMITSYTLFLNEEDFRRWRKRLDKILSKGKLRLVYDGHCDFCRSVLLTIRFFDVFRLIEFLDYHNAEDLGKAPGVSLDQADHGVIVLDKNGRQYAGFYAFRKMLWRMPALLWLAPLLYVPGVPVLGNRAYRWVVVNRSRLPVAARYRDRAPTSKKALSR